MEVRYTAADVEDALRTAHQVRFARTQRWWRYAVVRSGSMPVPASLNGKWFDLDEMPDWPPLGVDGTSFTATDRWEMREDGEVAVVYCAVAARAGDDGGGTR